MNMNNNPTTEQLRELIRGCNDSIGHHILWVTKTGDVLISRLPKELTPAGFQQVQPDMQLRYETFEMGNEYVGPEAADDDSWVLELFDSLTEKWPVARGEPKPECVGTF